MVSFSAFRKRHSSFEKFDHVPGFKKGLKSVTRSSNGAGIDSEHVDTYYHHCDMCQIRYDLIGKFESFVEDTQYILMRTGKVTLIKLLK